MEPFELDIVFAPDGFEDFESAADSHRILIHGYPLMNPDGIVRSKEAAGRPRDRAELPALRQFRDWQEARKGE